MADVVNENKESAPKPPAGKAFPSIDSLFRESWELFKKSVLNLFIFNIIVLLFWVALIAVFVVFLTIIGGATGLFGAFFQQGFEKVIINYLPSLLGAVLIFTPVFVIAAIIISSIQQAGTIIVLNEADKKISFGDIIKRSFRLVIPLFLVNLLMFLVIFGAAFVFILPALLLIFLFTFAAYEVILENKRWAGALKGSMQIVLSNFGDILARILLVFAINIGFGFASMLFGNIFSNVPVMDYTFSFGFTLIGILIGWYFSAYYLTLYKQAKSVTDTNKKTSMLWVWIIAIIGWIIAILLATVIISAVTAFMKSDKFKNSLSSGITPTSKTKQYTAEQYIKSGEIRFMSANELAKKSNLTEKDRAQIKELLEKAISDFRTATEKEPENYQAWYYRGYAYKELIGIAKDADIYAIESFNKAISLNSSDYNAYLKRGGIYYYNKQYEEAIKDFQKVTELKPEYANGFYNLGAAYKQYGAKESARKALNKALELTDKNNSERYKIEAELQGL